MPARRGLGREAQLPAPRAQWRRRESNPGIARSEPSPDVANRRESGGSAATVGDGSRRAIAKPQIERHDASVRSPSPARLAGVVGWALTSTKKSRAIEVRDPPVRDPELVRALRFFLSKEAGRSDGGPMPEEYQREAQRLLFECAAFAGAVERLIPRPPKPNWTVREENGQRVHSASGLVPRRVEEVPERLNEWARRILPYVALLAQNEAEVPLSVIEEGHRMVDLLAGGERKPLPTWQEGLIRAFERLATDWWRTEAGYPIGPKADINAVFLIVDEAAEQVGYESMPAVMRHDPFHTGTAGRRRELDGAIRELRQLKLAKPGERAGGRSKRVSPFTAAQRFAAAFGLPFPPRARDLQRESKSGRRLSQRTNPPSKRAARVRTSSRG
jgi:hypothetical protein